MQGLIPVTWHAFTTDRRGFGDQLLQGAIDLAKQQVTGVVVDVDNEENVYSLIVIDYIAKVAVLQIIPGAIDFWMSESIATSATGTNENSAYVDRADKLAQLREQLLQETRANFQDIADILGFQRSSSKAVPLINTRDDLFLTPSPQEFPRPFKETTSS